MSTPKAILIAAEQAGVKVDSYSPGDGVTRYRFFTTEPAEYFGGRGIYTALGAKEAMTFIAGFAQGRDQLLERAN
jgi:hypothetical protein